ETRDPHRLLGLDLAALGAGDHRSFGTALGGRPHSGGPLALVCTNGKRDRCCALLGRPLATELAASGVRGTWEVTHLGGHRFSPTVLVLPYGYAYGRAEAHAVKEVLHGAQEGRVVLEGCRGCSAWGRPGQAAELAVREAVGEHTAGALSVVRTEGAAPRWHVTVDHVDGRRWRVAVAQGASLPPRPESCGVSVLGSPARMDVVSLRELRTASALAS
ncbi:sucrase ferredoxin, partial [Streptomyces sp. NPDC007162]|uniref:sucrase ferredoxin n=1 Tax=Streptomyces sp. NPDC007162 TaxID=3156917 RepID=UPI003411059E